MNIIHFAAMNDREDLFGFALNENTKYAELLKQPQHKGRGVRAQKMWAKIKPCSLILATDEFGYMPIHFAAQFGQYRVLELLLNEREAQQTLEATRMKQLESRNHDGWTPLGLAIMSDEVECVKVLLPYFLRMYANNGKIIDTTSLNGYTPQSLAAESWVHCWGYILCVALHWLSFFR